MAEKRPTPRVRYPTRKELRALEEAERAASANGTRAEFDAEQARLFRQAQDADRKAGIPWWRRV